MDGHEVKVTAVGYHTILRPFDPRAIKSWLFAIKSKYPGHFLC